MDSELLRKLKSRRDAVDSCATAYGNNTPTSAAQEDTTTCQDNAQVSGLVSNRTSTWNGRAAAEDAHSQNTGTHGSSPSSKRVAFSSASLRGSVPDMGANRGTLSSAYPSIPSLPKKTEGRESTDKSELSRRLQARRGVVDSEGTTWEKLASASVADACLGGSMSSHLNAENDLADLQSGYFIDEVLEATLRQNLTGRFEDLRRAARHTSAVDPDSEALAECLYAGEALPWEVLRRGVRTWVCDVWVSEPLCLITQASRKSSSNSPTAEEEKSKEMSALPAILCLASDGELRVCVSVPAPSGVNEEADYAKLLNAYEVCSLQKACSAAAVPAALGFYFTRAASGGFDLDDDESMRRKASNLSPSLAVCFESEEEAQSCADAFSDFSAAPLIEEGSTELAAALLVRLFGDIGIAAEKASENDDEENPCPSSDWRTAVRSSSSLKAFMTDTRAFLQELDCLAGLA